MHLDRRLIAAFVLSLLLAPGATRAAIHHVDAAAAGANNGTSWANAFTNLQTALAAAATNDELRVAAGTYRPSDTGDRLAAFTLKNGLALYGGYPSGGGARDWNANLTTLSGDIGTPGDATDNSAHVVIGAHLARLDGVTVTLGYWDSNDVAQREGAGLYVDGNKFMTVANCRFIANHSWYGGAGIAFNFTANSATGPLVSNCFFSGNTTTYAGAQGGAMRVYHRVPVLVVDSTFADNTSVYGAAFWGQYCDPSFRNCVFARNTGYQGGALWISRPDAADISPSVISNCAFYGNRAQSTAGAIYSERIDHAADRISDCRFYANESTNQGGAIYLYRYGGVVEDCVFSGNRSLNHEAGALGTYYGSPLIRRVTAAGNWSGYRGGAFFVSGHPSYPASPRFENVLAAGNAAVYEGGALGVYYTYGGTAAVVNCTFSSNRTVLTGSSYTGAGIWMQEGLLTVTNTVLHGNRAGSGIGNEVSVLGAPSRGTFGRNLIAGGAAGFHNPNGALLHDQAANVDTNPLFVAGTAGTWTHAASYTGATGTTVLRDDNTTWATNALVGRLLNPNATNMLAFVISANADHTITVLGNASQAAAGDGWQLLDYRLEAASAAVDAGSAAVAPGDDLAHGVRPRGLADDVGAYENVITNDAAAPGAVTGLAAIGGQAQVQLHWLNPADADFAGVLVVRRAGAAPTGVPVASYPYVAGDALGDGVVAYFGPGSDPAPGNASSVTDLDLQDETPYHYRVFAFDRVPNYAAGAAASAATEVDATPPAPVSALSVTAGDATAIFNWLNPPPADYAGVLVLRRLGAPPTGVPSNAVAYTAGSAIGDGVVAYAGPPSTVVPLAPATWTDTGLLNETNYHYRFFAYDEGPLYAAPVATNVAPLAVNVKFVDIDAAPGGDGTSWASAYNSLTQALAQTGSGTNLWVAAGTYTPGGTRAATFQLVAGSGIYGGFAGNENSVTLRDWNQYPTILSGEIGAATNTDNCLHVVTASGADGAVIDGFTVTRGYAWDSGNDADPARDGGGLLVNETTATAISTVIRNCRFVDNAANYLGGAIALLYNSGSSTAGATISNCVFEGNYTFRANGDQGGAIYKYHYRPAWVSDCTFTGNRSYSGGAIRDSLGDTIIRRSTFTGNVGTYQCAAVYINRSSPNNLNALEISDSTFAANTTVHYGAVRLERGNVPGDVVRNCRFYANRMTGVGSAALHLYQFNGLVADSVFSGNQQAGSYPGGAISLEYAPVTLRNLVIAGTETYYAGGGIYAGSHPAYNTPLRGENLLIAGNLSGYYGGGVCVTDFGGNTSSWINCTIANNRSIQSNDTAYGGGGMYVRDSATFVTNSILWNNQSPGAGSQLFLSLASTRLGLGHTDLQGGAGAIANPNGATVTTGAGMLNAAPGFQDVRTGNWTAGALYAATSGVTVLEDAAAGWAPGALAGKLLNPNATVSNLLFYIAGNSSNTLTILGNGGSATNGAPYQIWDFFPKAISPCVDAGTAAGVTNDLLGTPRPLGAAPDLGVFERVPDGLPPAAVNGLVAVGGLDQVALSWTNPTNTDFAGVVIVRRTGAAHVGEPVSTNVYTVGQSLGNGTVVYAGTGASLVPGAASGWIDTGRDQLTTFHYAVYAHDGVPNYAARANGNATTLADGVPPDPVTGLQAVGGFNQVTLAWTNPASPDFAGVLVLRRAGTMPPTGVPGQGTNYLVGNTIGDGTVVYAGTGNSLTPGAPSGWMDTGLADLTAYAYTVFARDEVPNYSAGAGDDAMTGLAGVIFVNDDATGANTGLNWTDAYTNLYTAATNHAAATFWVAKGKYHPGGPLLPIPMQHGDSFIGGFAGTETALAQRDLSSNPTIISGDWTGDNASEMSAAPLVYWNLGNEFNSAAMDGFILEYGQNFNSSGVGGGAIGQHMSVRNGAINLKHCEFRFNTGYFGGAITHNYGFSTIENCLFHHNSASSEGGAIFARRGELTLRNCTFMDNAGDGADFKGKIDECCAGQVFAYNTIFYSSSGSVSVEDDDELSTFDHCNLSAPVGAVTTTDCIDANPLCVNPTAGNYRLLPASPCRDAGSAIGAPLTDLDGGVRPVGPGFDMGAYEFGNGQVPTGLLLMVR